jgi:uncharacterized glyoxalase superfamily protein PhnB
MSLKPAVVELVVDDIPTALAFYGQLGLDIPADPGDQPHVEVDFGGLRLAFDSTEMVRNIDPDWTPPSGGHRMALAFECDTPAEVDEAYARLVAAGAAGQLEPWDAFWGMRYAVIHDPDGNQLDLFAHLS